MRRRSSCNCASGNRRNYFLRAPIRPVPGAVITLPRAQFPPIQASGHPAAALPALQGLQVLDQRGALLISKHRGELVAALPWLYLAITCFRQSLSLHGVITPKYRDAAA